jgi:hypothetical protein
MKLGINRTLRTLSSERFLLEVDGKPDSGVLDVHYIENGIVDGTLILLDEKLASEQATGELLQLIDDQLLPMVSFEEDNLTITVVQGKVLGAATRTA